MVLTRLILVAAGVACSVIWCVALAEHPLPDPDEHWIEVRTAHFTLFGNAPQAEIERAGLGLEALRESLSRLQPDKKLNSPRPTFTFVFKNAASFAPYRFRHDGKGADVSGQFTASEDANFISLALQRGDHTERVVFHEYLHYFLHNNLPGIPTWLDEGFAEYYSTLQRLGDAITIGRPIMGHSQTLATEGYLPLSDLLRITRASDAYNESERSGIFYAQSWLTVHYLYSGDPALREKLADYLSRVENGESTEQAFPGAFGTDFAGFREQLESYRRDGEFPVTRASFADLEIDTGTTARKLTRPEYLTALGSLLANARSTEPRIAEAYFREALRIDPKHAPALTGLGLTLSLRGEADEAERTYRRALELAPEDAIALKRLGASRMDRFLANPDGPEALELLDEAEGTLERCVALNPDWGEAQALYGKALVARGDCDEGGAALRRAWRLLPSRWDLPHDLSLLLAGCGETDEAYRLIDDVLPRAPDRSLARSARDGAIMAELNSLIPLYDAGRYEEAERRVRDLVDRVDDADLREQVLSQLAELEQLNEHNRMIDRFNQGVAHFNAGQLESARMAFDDVVARAEDPALAAEARQMLEQVQRFR